MKVALISGRKSAATESRASELKIQDIYNGTLNKIPPYEELKLKYNLTDSEIAYVGDALIDIPVFEKVGVSIAVPNSHIMVKEKADMISGFGIGPFFAYLISIYIFVNLFLSESN